MNKIDCVIFDLDGTLWDTCQPIAACWGEVVRRLPDVDHIPTLEEIRSIMGMTPAQVARTLFPGLSPQRGMEVFDLCCQAENDYLSRHGGRLYPGVPEVFSLLPAFAIVSNCGKGYIEAFLQAHGVDCPAHLCSGDTGQDKWRNIQLIAERLNLAHPVYVGDTEQDCREASRAGVPFIHARYGFGRVEEAVPGIDSLLELPGLLERTELFYPE